MEMDSENRLLTSIWWHWHLMEKVNRKFVKTITFDDSGLLGVHLTDNQETFVFINVFLPFQCEDNYENYLNYLGKLKAVVEEIVRC